MQFGDGFLLVGGYTETRPTDGSFEYTDLDTIFQYDADSESFVERDEKLSHPAEAVGAVMVTEDVISCVPQSSLA